MDYEKRIVNDYLKEHYDDMNTIGLGELLLFGDYDVCSRFFETASKRSRILKAVLKVCDYSVSAREFARLISYEDFRKQRGVGETTALALKLYIFYNCGVDWNNPRDQVKIG